MNEKRYFIIFLVVVGVLIGIAAAVSYIEDPGGIFTKNTYEEGVANILLSGHNVGNIENYDERLLQKDLIKNDQRQIDMIVLGSSRAFQIHNSTLNGEEFKGQLFFNYGISAASLEDYIAILELYWEKGSNPRTVIIGVDPWILNANNGLNRWTTLKIEYQNGVARIGSMPIRSEQDLTFDHYLSLISLPIVTESIDRLFNHQNQTSYFQTDLEQSDVYIKLKDGSLMYPANSENTSIEQIDMAAITYANSDPIYSLGRFTQLDENSESLFESAIRYLKSKNTTVILFLPPYHPIVYNKMTTDPQYSNVKEAESYFKEVASRENITIIGSYDPNLMNLTSADFYDGMHPRREAIDKIFAAAVIGKKILGVG